MGAKANCIGRLFLTIFLVYPPFTNKIFEGFHCREVGQGDSVLIVDQNVSCFTESVVTGEYVVILATSVMLVAAFSSGMPALLLYKMWKVRAKIHERDEETLKL